MLKPEILLKPKTISTVKLPELLYSSQTEFGYWSDDLNNVIQRDNWSYAVKRAELGIWRISQTFVMHRPGWLFGTEKVNCIGVFVSFLQLGRLFDVPQVPVVSYNLPSTSFCPEPSILEM